MNRPVLLHYVIPAVLAVALSTTVSAQTEINAVSSAAVTARPAPRIDNFGIVSARYYRGAQPLGRDFDDLAAFGIKTVIDLTSDDGNPDEAALVEKAGMTFVKIPMTTREAPTSAEIAKFLSVVNDPQAQPVYVHCVGGRHRTGVMTAVYRITHEGWSGERAFSEMKQYKYGPDFLHPEFKKFVLNFKPSGPRTVTPIVATSVTAVP